VIDVERARYATQSYRQTEGRRMPLRRARMLLHLARSLSIAIHPDEIIVGNRSLLPRMGVIAPEVDVAWVDQELEHLPSRPRIDFNVRQAVRGKAFLLLCRTAGSGEICALTARVLQVVHSP
jgi:pyruvate-formate lyase